MHILASLNSQSHLQDTEKGSQVIIWITEKECFVNFTLSYHECSQVWLREGNIIKDFIVFNAILHHSLSFCSCPVFRRRVYTRMFVLPKGNLYNIHIWWVFSSVQFSPSVMSDSLWPHWLQHARPPCPSPAPRVYSNSCPLSQSVMPSNHLILCRPLLLPSIFASNSVFSNESGLHIRWPKCWSFSFNISLCNEHPGLISFRMDW